MRLFNGTRERMFAQARNLNPSLGDPFQNPVDLTVKDLAEEARRVEILKKQMDDYLLTFNALLEGK
jgi:hypothetical protein